MISRFAIAFWCLALLPPQLLGAGIMVNEYYNGSGTVGPGTKMVRDEYIEFVIVQESTASSLASLTFGDSNDATSQLQGVFRFDQSTLQQALDNAHLSAFLPGTMLVVKGIDLGPQSLAYDPLNALSTALKPRSMATSPLATKVRRCGYPLRPPCVTAIPAGSSMPLATPPRLG